MMAPDKDMATKVKTNLKKIISGIKYKKVCKEVQDKIAEE